MPYGIEALETLRVEKGYIHIGSDTDGTTLPMDIGFGTAVAKKTVGFFGRRSLLRAAALDPRRLTLVGLRPVDGLTRLPTGAQIAEHAPPALTQGHVTSSYFSPTLQRPVALHMLSRGAQRIGERVHLYHLGEHLEVEVVRTPFFDPAGERLRG